MGKAEKWQYGVVFDAGSSGTRIHIYRWLRDPLGGEDPNSVSPHTLPLLETHDKWTKKVHPGIATFGPTPKLVGPEHLAPLLEHALDYIPKSAVPDTPIFLLATAGMRLLPDRQRNFLLKEICGYFSTNTNFLVANCGVQVQVIPGETEGLYGWIAANYLIGGFDTPERHSHGKGHHTYGFLDMGGASAQIAFAPNATEAEKHANDLTLLRLRTIDGLTEEYQVFVTTWLGFGVNEARRRYVEALVESYKSSHSPESGTFIEMPDPCLPKGLRMTLTGELLPDLKSASATSEHLFGTGQFDECLRRAFPLLQKDAPCLDEPCLLNGVHVPAIDFDVNHFVGISEYWHTTHEIFETAHKDKAYDFNTYQVRVKEFCEQDWSTIKSGVADKTWGKKVDEQTAYEVCFKASWLINMLHDGIGIPRIGIEGLSGGKQNGTKDVIEGGKEMGYLDPFQPVNQIKSTEISWTLGKMVLYASSDILSTDSVLPVGFGSNEPGIPPDFHYPGGGGKLLSTNSRDGDNGKMSDTLHDTLFNSDSPHRIPGFLFLLSIVLIGVFYLCGRQRRSRLFNAVFGPPGKSGRVVGSIFPFMSSRRNINYERVLEEGDDLYDPAHFELQDVDGDETDDVKTGMPRGGITPRRTGVPGSLSPVIMDRRGLVVRTESRERIDLTNATKSRSGSPTRNKGAV